MNLKKETKIEIFFWLVALFVFSPRILLEVYEHKLKNSLTPFENNEWTVKDKDGNVLYENLTLPYDLRWKEQGTNRREWVFEKTINTSHLKNIKELGIVLGRMGDTDNVYFNDCLIGSTGFNVDTNLNNAYGWSHLRRYIVQSNCLSIPTSIIKCVIHKESGPGYGIYAGPFGFGQFSEIQKIARTIDFLKYGVIAIFGFGLILFVGAQYLFVFLISEKREIYGIFSLLSVCVGVFLFMTSTFPFLFFNYTTVFYKILHGAALAATILFLIFFQRKFHIFSRKVLIMYFIVSLPIFTLSIAQTQASQVYKWYELWHPFFLTAFIICYIQLLQKKNNQKNDIYFSKYLIAFTIFIICCLYDVAVSVFALSNSYLIGYAFTFFVLVVALTLSREYSDGFTKIEDQVIKRTSELKEALVSIQSLQLKKDEQARSFAHDIRSPLVALQVLKDIVSKDLSDDQRSLLKHTIIRINDLANTILPKNSDQEETNSKKASVFLWTVLDKLISEKRIEYQNLQNCQFELKNTSPIFDMHVFCVEVELTRILSNMINNSVEARIDDSMMMITLNCEKKSNVIEISVTDNGKGIPEGSIHKIFQPGYSEGKKHGTGLGLTNAKRLIESWNGTIELCSTGTTGTTFTIKLPIANKAPWLASSINLSKIANLVIIDDQSYVIDTWKQKIKSLNKSFQVYWIQNMDDWIKNPLNDLPREETLFLVDQDLSSNKTGLDMIEHLNLTKCAILVTANEDDIKLRQKVVFMGLSILPKSLIHEIPLET